MAIGTTFFARRRVGRSTNPSLALFNHSCHPNYRRVSHGRVTVGFAVRDIGAGEEITDTYCATFACAEKCVSPDYCAVLYLVGVGRGSLQMQIAIIIQATAFAFVVAVIIVVATLKKQVLSTYFNNSVNVVSALAFVQPR